MAPCSSSSIRGPKPLVHIFSGNVFVWVLLQSFKKLLNTGHISGFFCPPSPRYQGSRSVTEQHAEDLVGLAACLASSLNTVSFVTLQLFISSQYRWNAPPPVLLLNVWPMPDKTCNWEAYRSMYPPLSLSFSWPKKRMSDTDSLCLFLLERYPV